MEQQRTALVIGAAGFLGRYVVGHLRAQGWRVVGIGRGVAALEELLDAVYEAALPDPSLDLAIRTEKPVLCVHAAGPSSVPDSIADPVRDFRFSVLTWMQVLEALRQCNPRCRTVLLSSAAVYGQPAVLPVTENTPVNPMSPYGFHRYYCELVQDEYRRLYGMEGTALRIFSAYGAGLRRQVVWDICSKALSGGGEMVLFGTGDETRDFIHAEDVAQVVGLLADQSGWQPVYNLASGREVSIRDLARLILALLPDATALKFDGRVSLGMPVRWRANIDRLYELGFEPAYTLQDGVSTVVAACLQEMAGQ